MTFGIADNRNGNEMVSIFEIGHERSPRLLPL